MKKDRLLPTSIILAAVIVAVAWVYTSGVKTLPPKNNEDILQANGFIIPVVWGNLGASMMSAGIIDKAALEKLYALRGDLATAEKKLLYGEENGEIVMNEKNANFILNLLWALGLSNKNRILEVGPMADPRYGGADRFASTGGWTLAKGSPMDHYSAHVFMKLSEDKQQLVERVAKNIYRPCCDNATHFPDCNHGMAMLGLLELMASQGAGEEEMYRVALQVNSYWFPETYFTIGKYLELQGTSLSEANPKEILGVSFSSARGYRNILSKVTPVEKKSGGSCGV